MIDSSKDSDSDHFSDALSNGKGLKRKRIELSDDEDETSQKNFKRNEIERNGKCKRFRRETIYEVPYSLVTKRNKDVLKNADDTSVKKQDDCLEHIEQGSVLVPSAPRNCPASPEQGERSNSDDENEDRKKKKEDNKSRVNLAKSSPHEIENLVRGLTNLLTNRLEYFSPETLFSSLVIMSPHLAEPLRRGIKIIMTKILEKKGLAASLKAAVNALGDGEVRKTLRRTKRPLIPRALPKHKKVTQQATPDLEVAMREELERCGLL